MEPIHWSGLHRAGERPYDASVDDLSARPADHEREALAARIDRAAAAGQISTVDRDIRLGNVKSAQSRAEPDLAFNESGYLATRVERLDRAGLWVRAVTLRDGCCATSSGTARRRV